MIGDGAALEVLRAVAEDWATDGPLGRLRELTRQVWLTDLTRHEPDLGDDAVTLGIQASRNICNLAVKELRELPGVEACDRRSLEIRYAGRELHVGKAPSDDRGWHVGLVDWTTSELRDLAARANSAVYQPLEGTLFEELGPAPDQQLDASRLRYLHYLWQGLPDGTVRDWLGFPRVEPPFWFAVIGLDDARRHGGDGPADGRPAVPDAPPSTSFDELGEPDLPLTRRTRPASARSAGGGQRSA